MRLCALILIFFSSVVAWSEIHLESGEVRYLELDEPTRVTCDRVGEGETQSVTTKTCKFEQYAKCQRYSETTITGRFCAQGKVCGRVQQARCLWYNTTGACGPNSCKSEKKCGLVVQGQCMYYDVEVSCY